MKSIQLIYTNFSGRPDPGFRNYKLLFSRILPMVDVPLKIRYSKAIYVAADFLGDRLEGFVGVAKRYPLRGTNEAN